MKQPKKRWCSHCKVALLDRLVSSCSQYEKAENRYRRAANDYYGSLARWHPPDGKAGASSDREDAPKPDITKEQSEPIRDQPLTQAGWWEKLSFGEKSFALWLFAKAMLEHRSEGFYQGVVGDSRFPVCAAYMRGAADAARIIWSHSGVGKN